MKNSSPSQENPPGNPENRGLVHWAVDDDIAMGCECAYPELQIERWSLEQAQAQPQHVTDSHQDRY